MKCRYSISSRLGDLFPCMATSFGSQMLQGHGWGKWK